MTSTKPIEFLEPWEPFTSEQAQAFLHELEIELASGHGLQGVGLTALAHSGAADDALFQMEDGSALFRAISRGADAPSNRPGPDIEFFRAWQIGFGRS